MRHARVAALVVSLLGGLATAGAAELERLPAVLHVHSTLSTGDFSLDELAALAEKNGVGALLLTENYLLRVEYGPPPFRALTRVVREERSILDGGVGRFLDAVAEARRRNPRVLLIAGVEVVPHYYWTGSPLALEMTAHNTQKNLLVFGLAGAPLESLPVAGNAAAGGFAWTAALDLVPGLLLIPGALLLMLKRRAVQRVGHAVVVVRRRRWLAGGLLCAVGALALARAWPFTGDPYPPYSDLGLAPHQALIEYVDRLGGVTVWSLPEARDSGEQWLGPVRVAWQTDPYPDDLLRTFRNTAFGAVYEDTTRFDLGGGGWDQLLRQYAAGERSRPAWAVGESGFHGVSAGKSIGPVQTVFLVSERTERAVLDAMKRGRMYALFRGADPALALAEFSVTDGVRNAVSGETLTTREGSLLEVRVGIDAVDGAARAVRVALLRNGTLAGAWTATTPFRVVQREVYDGGPAFYRLDVRGPGRLLSNPIFLKRP
ncbi:MAG: hypothetical protein DME12_00600 [Candidatus Rokuibacteriota bacterium]|nr:MAG: hypothetical protein DME12_00600 [Candidatus Rokubacteria bacterium]